MRRLVPLPASGEDRRVPSLGRAQPFDLMQASVPDEPGWSADVAIRAIASGDAKRP